MEMEVEGMRAKGRIGQRGIAPIVEDVCDLLRRAAQGEGLLVSISYLNVAQRLGDDVWFEVVDCVAQGLEAAGGRGTSADVLLESPIPVNSGDAFNIIVLATQRLARADGC